METTSLNTLTVAEWANAQQIERRKSAKFGKKEVMLVAWALVKQYQQSFRKALKKSWEMLQSKSSDFFNILARVIKTRRQLSLKELDSKALIESCPTSCFTTIIFNGWFWNEKYNVLF